MDYDIECWKVRLIGPSTINLSYSTLDPIPNHGAANLARDGDSEPRTGKSVFCCMDRRVPSVPSAPTLVTPSVIYSSPNSAFR